MHLDYSRIVFLSLSNLEKSNKPSFKFLDREYFALPKALAEVLLLSEAKYTEKNLQQIIRTVMKFQDPVMVTPTFNRPCNKLLKARVPNVY